MAGIIPKGRKTPLKNTATSWLESGTMFGHGSRYVFFRDLLNKDKEEEANLYKLGQTAKKRFTSISDLLKQKDDNEDDEKSVSYIEAYIAMLRKLAEKERGIEEKYIQRLKIQQGISIEDYISNNKFDYIKFIMALNEVHMNVEDFKKILHDQARNMSQAQKDYNKLVQNTAYLNQEHIEKNKNLYKNLREQFYDGYTTYSQEIAKIISRKLTPTMPEIMSSTVNTLFAQLSRNQPLINELAKQKTPTEVRNAIINYVQNEVKNNETRQNIIDKFNEQCTQFINGKPDGLIKILNNITNSTYDNVVTQHFNEVKRILTRSIKSGEGLAKILEDSPASFDMVLDMVNIDPNKATSLQKNLITKIETTLEALDKTKVSDENNKSTIRGYRWKITHALNQLIEPAKQQFKASHQTIETYLELLEKQYQSSFAQAATTGNIQEWFKRSLQVEVDAPGMAEVNAAVESHRTELIEGLKSHIKGKKIQLKDDLTFTYHMHKLSDYAITYDKGSATNLENAVNHFHDDFLQNYNKRTGGATNVIEAANSYIQSMRTLIESREEFLDKANEAVQKEGEDYLNETILGSVSVKEYHFYNNEFGYHMGSMGGSDRVSAAVPNILKMLELGGISVPDADLIIQALLNCFQDSVLGEGYKAVEKSITDYLLGGAAMMLFDDGFANCEAFLEKMKGDLLDNHHLAKELPGVGVMHLLYLNGVYIPQSYILFNIVEKLEEVYKNILEDTTPEQLTSQTSNNYLVVINPLNDMTLKDVNREYKTSSQERWNVMAQIANSEVKIKFMFMAGMLDILQNIQKVFHNPAT